MGTISWAPGSADLSQLLTSCWSMDFLAPKGEAARTQIPSEGQPRAPGGQDSRLLPSLMRQLRHPLAPPFPTRAESSLCPPRGGGRCIWAMPLVQPGQRVWWALVRPVATKPFNLGCIVVSKLIEPWKFHATSPGPDNRMLTTMLARCVPRDSCPPLPCRIQRWFLLCDLRPL